MTGVATLVYTTLWRVILRPLSSNDIENLQKCRTITFIHSCFGTSSANNNLFTLRNLIERWASGQSTKHNIRVVNHKMIITHAFHIKYIFTFSGIHYIYYLMMLPAVYLNLIGTGFPAC